MSINPIRQKMCDVARRLWDRGLIGGAEGNLSCRIGPAEILCTPAGAIKGDLSPDELVLITMDGVPVGAGKPSSEIRLHLRIYRDRADVPCVIHAHPPMATAFAVAGKTIPDDVLPEAGVVLGRVALVRFAIPGTDDVGDAVAPFLQDHKTFILDHHGAVALGSDLEDAYCRMETLERVAHILLVATLLGGAKKLPPEGFDWLKKVGLSGKL